MRVTLLYNVPVSVVVDCEEETIAKVVIHDDCIEDAPSDVLSEDGAKLRDQALAETAKRIADEADFWPAWQYS